MGWEWDDLLLADQTNRNGLITTCLLHYPLLDCWEWGLLHPMYSLYAPRVKFRLSSSNPDFGEQFRLE